MGRLQKLEILNAVKIKHMEYLRAAAKSEMLKAKAEYPSGSGGEKSTGTNANAMENIMIACTEASVEADAARSAWKEAEGKALRIISALGDCTQAIVLQMYYLDFMTIEKIAEALHYSWRQVWRFKKKGERMLG